MSPSSFISLILTLKASDILQPFKAKKFATLETEGGKLSIRYLMKRQSQ